MAVVVYSTEDKVSAGAAAAMKRIADLKETEPTMGMRRFIGEGMELLELKSHHLHAEYLDGLGADCIIILSRHSSAENLPAFTVHAEGNWGSEAKLGGLPKQLSVAAPVQMLNILTRMKANSDGIPVTYEATHHGPLLKTPSLYAEIGGSEEAKSSPSKWEALAKCVLESLVSRADYDRIALGIGAMHYADRFTRRALEGKFAFAHIMPKYRADCADMIDQAIERSSPRPEVAVVDWQALKSAERAAILKKLDEFGLDYVKI